MIHDYPGWPQTDSFYTRLNLQEISRYSHEEKLSLRLEPGFVKVYSVIHDPVFEKFTL